MSEPDDELPPAGGFGAPAPNSRTRIEHTPLAPRPSGGALHIVGLAIGTSVLVTVFFMVYLEYRKREASKWAEAENLVGEVATKIEEAYRKNHGLCPSAAPVPRDFDLVRGRRYTAPKAEWENDPGWKCLDYASDYPSRYQIQYVQTGEFFTIRAVGDIDANDIRSTYTYEGHIDPVRRELVFDSNGVESSNKGE